MEDEFKKNGSNEATSVNGFSVKVDPHGGVLYRDATGDTRIDSEWLVDPPRILLYRKGFDKMSLDVLERMFGNVSKALESLGHRVEIWTGEWKEK